MAHTAELAPDSTNAPTEGVNSAAGQEEPDNPDGSLPPSDALSPDDNSDYEAIHDEEFRNRVSQVVDEYRSHTPEERIHGSLEYHASVQLKRIVADACKGLVRFKTQFEGPKLAENKFALAVSIFKTGFDLMRELKDQDQESGKAGRARIGEFINQRHGESLKLLIDGVEGVIPRGRIGNKPMMDGEKRVPLDALVVLSSLVTEAEYAEISMSELSELMQKLNIGEYNLENLGDDIDGPTRSCFLAAAEFASVSAALEGGRKMTPGERAVSKKFGEQFGLSESETVDMINTWVSNKRGKKGKQLATSLQDVAVNLGHFIYLETQGVDIEAAVSNRGYGIRNLMRYSPEQLREQQERVYNPDGVSLAIVAESDWNGSMSAAEKELKEGTGWEEMIFTEAGSVTDLARRLLFTRDHHGPVKNLVIFAHGSIDGVTLGSKHDLSIEMIEASRGIEHLIEKGILDPDCEVIFQACSVGKEGGLAQAISRKSGTQISAAPFISSGIRRDEETGLAVHRKYGNNEESNSAVAPVEENVDEYGANIYRNGELIHQIDKRLPSK